MAGRIAYYGGIVTNGLVLDLDAAKKDSYPGTGTSWRNIAGNSNNGTLTNGPTFNSNNGGSIALMVGRDSFSSRYFNGNIAQSLIYNRALSATEILQNYNATKTRLLR